MASGNRAHIIDGLFRAIWVDGLLPDNQCDWTNVVTELGLGGVIEDANSTGVKDALRQNTESAITKGVFGVPTLICNGNLFWGFDALDLFLEYLSDDQIFNDEQMRAIDNLTVSAKRNR